MSGRDWQAFDAELRARASEIVEDLLGKPVARAGQEWRWGRKGSLSVVIAGPKAGMWFDHEAGEGGGLVELVGRVRGLHRREALDWTADRIGMADEFGRRHRSARRATRPSADTAAKPRRAPVVAAPIDADNSAPAPEAPNPAAETAARAARMWTAAQPAPEDRPYLIAKHVAPLALRADARGHLVVPLQDVDGALRSLETIAPDGAKRYLAGGAKRGHFAVVGAAPAPLAEPTGPLLICEGWATGASLHMATGHSVIAAMDAGNLLPVAEALRARFAHADLVLVADNDARPDRDTNPGVEAARRAALAVDARLAVPETPGDANDIFCAEGPEAVSALVAGAARIPPPPPTYPAPVLTPDEARASLTEAVSAFMAAIPQYWAAVEAAREAAKDADAARDLLDFNVIARAALPPLLGLPVDVGLGKTSRARNAIADLIASKGMGARKVVYAVPRHDLGVEQVAAFEALGLRAMLWKGRTAPDPTPETPDQLMCLDPEATFDALEVELPIEQSCCKVKRGGELHLCAHFHACGYQRQKPLAQAAQVVVCAHDSLFHMKPEAIGTVGLLVIDEAFWQSGLRGLDGKATLTQDGLEPGRTSLVCYGAKGRIDMGATADLVAARTRLWKALQVAEPGPLRHGLLEAVGLTPEECRNAATLERRRMRDAGLLPGMSTVERRKRIETVLPRAGEPWAPPGRCATLWLILAEALETECDAAGAELAHERTESGSVRALRLRWRSRLRGGWAAEAPILHLDATLRPELVQSYLPRIDIGAPVAARQPNVRIRQVTGSPTSARALTPAVDAPERDRRSAATRLRDLRAWIDLRAGQCHRPGQAVDLLVVGQKAAIDALRAAGLPPRVEAVHFNALSGLDRWGGIGGMIVLGRTLPAPRTVELIAMALTGRVPIPNPEDAGWWYPVAERRLRLARDRTAVLSMEAHADPIAEAVRWSICEGELIQAIGRGRGVNRTTDTGLEIDLLTDVVLPVTVDALAPWAELRPTRRDLMALSGIVLENAADMAACFPELWPSAAAARQDRSRSVTNCYYRTLYNSQMSHSSAELTYRPEGAGHRACTARVDLARIPDPEAWLTNRLGPLAWTGASGDWGLRRMVLHYAHLCAAAGGVDAFLIGTEMPGLTTIRSGASTYPAVQAYRDLLADVRSILGSGTKIGYAADWSEYFGHQPGDGSGDVFFHLDPLWADPEIDFVGVDNYMPLSDWRDGFDHADAAEGWPAIYDRAYLQTNIAGGEGFDWFYDSAADRAAQTRTPITDGAASKPWVFRYKDLRAWWSNPHYNRPGGVESGTPTAWAPQSKPVWFTELGCPAIDRGTNQPNVFFDPKSSESFTPHFSRGWRDDAIQRAYLEATYLWWGTLANNPVSSVFGGRMVYVPECAAWTWDARPYPFFPALTDVWTDGGNWRLGHWLTGRLGSVSLAALVRHLCMRAGLPEARVDVSGLWGAVDGYIITALESPRASITTLSRHFGFDAVETEGVIRFVRRGRASVATVAPDDLVAAREGDVLELTRAQETELPQALKWQLARADEDYDAALVEARRITVDTTRIASESFPMAVPPEEAERRCRRALMEAWVGRETAAFRLPPSRLALDPADVIRLAHDGRLVDLRLVSIADAEARGIESVRQDRDAHDLPPGPPRPSSIPKAVVFGAPDAVLMDLPQLSEDQPAHRPLIAAHAAPWPGEMAVFRSPSTDGFALLTTTQSRARIGTLVSDLYAGPTSRFDLGNTLVVDLLSGTLESVTDLTLFGGANALAVESAPRVWEIVQAGAAELLAPGRYRLTRLLRGQRGTEGAMGNPAPAGARAVVLDDRLAALPIAEADLGLPWNWRIGPASRPVGDETYVATSFTPGGAGLRPFSVAHVGQPWRKPRAPGDLTIRWVRRSRSLAADNWGAVEAPLAEEVEAYAVEILDGATVKRVLSTSGTSALYTASQQTSDWGAPLGPGDTLTIRIFQLSTLIGRGAPKTVTLTF